MSTASNRSYRPNRSLNSGHPGGARSRARSRAGSRATLLDVNFEDGYSYALRIAYRNHILQPRKKRKEYVAGPKPAPRVHTFGAQNVIAEFMPGGANAAQNLKLPHSFRGAVEKRMQGVLMGIEKMPGYNDAAVKRTFAEAYTAFTADSFRKTADKDRKLEPFILMLFSSASKAQKVGKAPDDESWKPLVDRHLAMFVRILVSVVRDNGYDQSRPDLLQKLTTLEKKLLTNDQNLFLDAGQEGNHKTIEVEIPVSYDVKDMHMVQLVARIFGRTPSQVQSDLDRHMPDWTEEAAMKDLKAYQNRLTSGASGALRRQDFDVDEAFDEWKKAEIHHVAQLLLEILNVRPELAGTRSNYEKPLPGRPASTFGEDQAYAELGRMLSNRDSTAFGLDGTPSFSSLSMDDGASIRTVDEPGYVFIPPDPRAYYKFVLKYAMSYDQLHPEETGAQGPLSKASTDLLTELAVQWRLTQPTRHITLLEVAAQKFFDMEIKTEELYEIFELVKEGKHPEVKKPPQIQLYSLPLSGIERRRWTIQDHATYQHLLSKLNDAMLRELHDNVARCFETKAPSIGPSLMFIMNHIQNDEAFSRRSDAADQFKEILTATLTEKAAVVYREYLDAEIPQLEDDWDFGHIVKLGKAVVGLCEKIRKRYRRNPEIMGVSPFAILVSTMFPNFEEDTNAIIQRVVQLAKDRGLEVNLQDGFDLYKELVEIRKIHNEVLPKTPFAFPIEDVLDEFVWRWIKGAETRMEEFVEEAIKQDQFQVRKEDDPDSAATDVDADRHSHSITDAFQLFNQTADQIMQLEWADNVHHARFMTALAKAFSAGIGRYCEIIEQRFAKEMDRPTAQELASANKTTQERFMQYAKDALSTKERVEPFQFYPESFVKLNNIGYAMQALDKLEKVLNVDRLAEIIREVDGPPKLVDRKNGRYVFTVKIVEAEDLKACDPNGTSDPYVVLCDEYQKRLAKTRVIMRNLNPRWDESVDITVQGPLNLIATIWDYDTFGDHDFVGRTSLKLDPIHFSDYLPREFWLDLDTQGRVLLRISMEGERDDIQFHFGKAFRHLKRAERDMVRKITDKVSKPMPRPSHGTGPLLMTRLQLITHINASLSKEALRGLLSRGLASSMAALWQKRTAKPAPLTELDIANALDPLFTYFNENFAIMKQTLTDATMISVMTRLWKEVLMAIENLLVPPLSEKPSSQKALTQAEMDVANAWLKLLFEFFHAKDDQGEVLGVPTDVLKSPKWHELQSLNFFYFDSTELLVRTSERMAAATAQRAEQQLQSTGGQSTRVPGPSGFGASLAPPSAFASMGTIRRGKSIMMSRNLGTMRAAKAEKRKEAQADPSDDMILRILRMRPEAAGYLKERYRQKERQAAQRAAALIVRQSVTQGWNSGPAFGGAQYGRNNLPRR